MVFTRLTESLTFHASPSDFISTRLATANATGLLSSPIARASILNRNVHIVTSYSLCKQILTPSPSNDDDDDESSGTYAAAPAYKELMRDWFPAPNVLLEDGDGHRVRKARWGERVADLDIEGSAGQVVKGWVEGFRKREWEREIDLYDELKDLSWQLLLGTFLSLKKGTDAYDKIEQKQEELLRGQFSMFPVAANVFFWQSARSRGLQAVRDLGRLLAEEAPRGCPFPRGGGADETEEEEDVRSHCLLFTSSIANKALASLLMALVANVFLMDGGALANVLRSQERDERRATLRSVILETERLSPPVVGVMRRVVKDVSLDFEAEHRLGQTGYMLIHQIPAGHDAWLYFVGANRDETVYRDAQRFHFDRFMPADGEGALPFAFGGGAKTCLGVEIVRKMVSIVVEELLEANVSMEIVGAGLDLGVKGWLGWEEVDPAITARDLKQLPCQRPRKPVVVKVKKGV